MFGKVRPPEERRPPSRTPAFRTSSERYEEIQRWFRTGCRPTAGVSERQAAIPEPPPDDAVRWNSWCYVTRPLDHQGRAGVAVLRRTMMRAIGLAAAAALLISSAGGAFAAG